MNKSLLSCGVAIALSVWVCFPLDCAVRAAVPEPGVKDKVDALIKELASKDEAVRLKAVTQLQEFGPKAAPAAAALSEALADKSEDVALNAAIALGKIGKGAVPELKAPLLSNDENVRYYALSAVGWIGPEAKVLAPRIMNSLNHKSENLRRKAAYALGSILAHPRVTLAMLIDAFADSNPDVRQAASEAVAKFGATAVPGLIEALGDDKASIRRLAVQTLGEVGGDAKVAIPNLKKLLLQTPGKLQPEAAEALAKIGKDAIPTLVEATRNAQAAVRRLGVNGLSKMGAVAVPELVDALGSKFVDVRRLAAQLLAPQRINDKMVVLGLAYALKDKDEQVRVEAVQGLQMLALGAKLAAPLLTAALVDGNMTVRQTAFQTLQVLGHDPHAALVKELKNKELAVRVNAASLLISKGYKEDDAFRILNDALKEKDNTLQMQAVSVLLPRGQQIKESLPILEGGLKNKSLGVRLQALQGLQQLNRQASAAAPAVLELLHAEDSHSLRQQAIQTLQSIGGDTKLMLPAFQKIMKDGDGNLRSQVLQLAGQHGVEGLKLILTALHDSDPNIKQQATWALYNVQGADLSAALTLTLAEFKQGDNAQRMVLATLLGRMGEKAVPHLLEALRDQDRNVRWSAVNGLQGQRSQAKKIVPQLVEMFEKSKDQEIRQMAIQGLGRLGPDAFVPLFALVKKEKDDNLRANLLYTLAQFGDQAKEMLPYLLESAQSKSAQVRAAAANALGGLNKYAGEVVPPLNVLIKDGDQNVRYTALHALARLGDAGQLGLIEVLKGKDDQLNGQALQYLRNLNAKIRPVALPVLINTLKTSKNAQVRWSTCMVLANMGTDAKDAVTALTAALQDTDPTVRSWAQNALNRIPQKKEK